MSALLIDSEYLSPSDDMDNLSLLADSSVPSLYLTHTTIDAVISVCFSLKTLWRTLTGFREIFPHDWPVNSKNFLCAAFLKVSHKKKNGEKSATKVSHKKKNGEKSASFSNSAPTHSMLAFRNANGCWKCKRSLNDCSVCSPMSPNLMGRAKMTDIKEMENGSWNFQTVAFAVIRPKKACSTSYQVIFGVEEGSE